MKNLIAITILALTTFGIQAKGFKTNEDFYFAGVSNKVILSTNLSFLGGPEAESLQNKEFLIIKIDGERIKIIGTNSYRSDDGVIRNHCFEDEFTMDKPGRQKRLNSILDYQHYFVNTKGELIRSMAFKDKRGRRFSVNRYSQKKDGSLSVKYSSETRRVFKKLSEEQKEREIEFFEQIKAENGNSCI